MRSQGLAARSALSAAMGMLAAVLVTLPLHGVAEAADAWYQVVSVKFKPGKTAEALKIIHERFHKVDKTVGRKVLPFDYQTGEWDHIVYFPFDPARMDTIPPGSEWMKAFAEQEGGMEQAQKVFQSYLDLIATSKVEMARLPSAWVP